MANKTIETMDTGSKVIHLPQRIGQQSDANTLCKFIHPSLMSDGNLVIQFVNQNCYDSATIIGGMKGKVMDPSRIPAYLAQHEGTIKTTGIYYLQQHLRDNQSPIGLNESLTLDDYSISFMAASLSPRGSQMHPGGRNEGPLFYFLFDGLIDDVSLKYAPLDQENPRAYFVNAYIHLVDAAKRRNAISKKQKDDKSDSANQAKKPKMTMTQMGTVRRPPYQFNPPNNPSVAEFQAVQHQISNLVDVIQERIPPGQQGPSFPALPTATPIQWPGFHNLPELPDDQ